MYVLKVYDYGAAFAEEHKILGKEVDVAPWETMSLPNIRLSLSVIAMFEQNLCRNRNRTSPICCAQFSDLRHNSCFLGSSLAHLENINAIMT